MCFYKHTTLPESILNEATSFFSSLASTRASPLILQTAHFTQLLNATQTLYNEQMQKGNSKKVVQFLSPIFVAYCKIFSAIPEKNDPNKDQLVKVITVYLVQPFQHLIQKQTFNQVQTQVAFAVLLHLTSAIAKSMHDATVKTRQVFVASIQPILQSILHLFKLYITVPGNVLVFEKTNSLNFLMPFIKRKTVVLEALLSILLNTVSTLKNQIGSDFIESTLKYVKYSAEHTLS